MADEYDIKSTSKASADVGDRLLSSTTTTRRVIRSELVNNPNNADACVKISILHQKKKTNDEWEDIERRSLATLKAGEISKLVLDSEETLTLLRELKNLFSIHAEKGVPRGEKKVVVGFDSEVIKADPQRSEIIRALLDQGYSNEVWAELIKVQPDLATRLSLLRIHDKRMEALKEFESSMTDQSKNEAYWQSFFENNTWIFGYGLNYKFLESVQPQPNYGGTAVSGIGGQRGDFLTVSAAEVRFSVLVEVKKPQSLLLGKEYRNSAYPAGVELSGGISQIQVNCRKWETEGSRTDENREFAEGANMTTVHPKGILVVGHTIQLDTAAKKISFELLRRNTMNPEIITFDELYERARYIVSHIEEMCSDAIVEGR